MPRIFAIDLSLHAGFCVLDDNEQIVDYGTIEAPEPKKSGTYPWNYLKVGRAQAQNIWDKIEQYKPDVIVVEAVNKGRNRWSQLLLDGLHYALVEKLEWKFDEIHYLDTSAWRKCLGLKLTKEQRSANKLPKAKKKAAGIKGKVTPKHLAVEFASKLLGRTLKMKENDAAEACALAVAYQRGCPVSKP